MGVIKDLHAKQNSKSQDSWDVFESHRVRVTDLAIDSASAVRSTDDTGLNLAVLGAGNGNDMAIESLLEVYDSIDLFDFDPEAMERNRSRYANKPEVLKRVQWIDSADITGIVDKLEPDRQHALPIDDDLLGAALHPPVDFTNQRYDVVLSTCTLSQLIQTVDEIYGHDSHQSQALILAVRDGHLGLMMRLMKATAVGILVTDFVSSDTLPEILDPEISEEQLFGLVDRALRERNFFSGANPLALRQRLNAMMRSAGAEIQLNLTSPWVWKWHGPKSFCVAAIQFFRSN